MCLIPPNCVSNNCNKETRQNSVSFPFEKVNRTLLKTDPPRTLPVPLVLSLVWFSLRKHPFGFPYLLPLLIGGLMAVGLLKWSHAGQATWNMMLMLLTSAFGVAVWRIRQQFRTDMDVLVHGRVVSAQVIQVRPDVNEHGQRQGTFIDLLIPVESQRISAGSFWIPDESESARLKDRTHILVICLPRVPGTWYLLEPTVPDAVLHLESMHQSTAQLEHDHQ